MGKHEIAAALVVSVMLLAAVALLLWGPAEVHDPALVMLGTAAGLVPKFGIFGAPKGAP